MALESGNLKEKDTIGKILNYKRLIQLHRLVLLKQNFSWRIKVNQFKEQIDRINPGRLIDTNKMCPYIKDKCVKDKCNAFVAHHEINIVSLEEKISDENKGIDWEKNLEIDNWKKHAISKSAIGPDDQDTLYVRVRNSEIGQGRCVI